MDYAMYSAATFNILVNGKRKSSKLIYHERGIKQGDHISPYIFINCAEYSGRLIHFCLF